MTDITSAIQPWRKLLNKFQPYTEIRHGLIGDGNGTVQVAAFPGWSWIRYDDVQSKLSMVRNSAYAMLPDGVPVVVGKRYHTDEYEQVLRIDTAQYSSAMDQDTINQYLLTPHGISHRGLGSDPAPIDLNNIVVGKVVPDDPASLSVEIYSFVYEYGLTVSLYVGGLLDLTAHVPANANHHRYVLVYLEQATGTAGAVAGEIIPVPVGLPSVPNALPDTIPLAIVLLVNGQTEILIADIIQWKLIWGVVGGTVGPHTHTDDTSGGTSLIGIEELMVACWVDITIDGNAISPTDVYHRLLVSEGMYIVGDDVSVELITIHPDPVHGCGQLLFLRVVDSPMYASYNVILRHGIGNIQLNADTDVAMHAGDHVLLICDGTYWHDIGLGGLLGGAPSPHPLNSVHHSGELADGQAPQFLKTDGTRDLTGNLAVDPAVTIDGVDISAHAIDVDAHHAEIHIVNSTGPHAEAGLTIGHVLRVSGAAAFSFAQLQHGDLGGVGGDDHHARQHGITTAADHTVAGAAMDVVGLSGVNTLGILTPDSDVFNEAAEKLLKADADGGVRLDHLELGNVAGAIEGQLFVADSITMSDDAWIGIGVAAERIIFDAAGDISFMGCNVGIGTVGPGTKLAIYDTDIVSMSVTTNKADSAGVASFSANAIAGSGILYMGAYETAAAVVRAGIALGDWGMIESYGQSGLLISVYSNSPLVFATNNLERMRILQGGNVGIGATVPTALLDINSNVLRLRTAKTPASAGAAGNAGDICWDATYFYVCVAANTWERVAHAAW